MVSLAWIEDDRIETNEQNIIDSIIYAQGDDKFVEHLYDLAMDRLDIDKLELMMLVYGAEVDEV